VTLAPRGPAGSVTSGSYGLDLVDPGLVLMPEWRAQANPEHVIPCYAAVGRKP